MNANVDIAQFAITSAIGSAKLGDREIDLTTLPPQSIAKLLRGGWAHYFGNEVASKVSTDKKAAQEAGQPATEQQIAEWKAEYTAEALESLLSGKVSSTARGPRGTTEDTVYNKLVLDKCVALLKLNNLVMPSGEKELTFPDGSRLTRAMLLERVGKKYGESLRIEARKQMEKLRKDAEKALAQAQASGGDVLESMGF